MKSFRDLSIRSKLVLLILSVSLLSVVLVGGVRLVWDLKQDQQALAQELSTLADMLGNRSSAALAFEDAQLAQENLDSLRTLHHVQLACLYRNDGTPMAVYRRDKQGNSPCPPVSRLANMSTHFETQRLHIASPIYQGSQLLGWIYLGSDLSIIESRLGSQIAFSILTLLAAILVAALLAGWLQRLIAGPVEMVTAAARDIEQSGDYNRRAPVSGSDEVGELARRFNAMLDSLQMRTRELAESRAEQAVLLTRYRSLFNHAGDVILLADAQSGRILDINPAARKRYGYTHEELLEMNIRDLNVDKESRDVSGLMKKVRIEGKAVFERHHRARDGTVFPVEVSSRLITLDDRPVFLAIIRDLSERRVARERIEQSEAKFRTLFNNAGDAIVILHKGKFVDCNPVALEVFQCRKVDIIGSTPLRFSPPTQYDGQKSENKAIEKINAALNGVPQRFDWLHTHLDGSPFDAEVSLNRIDLNGEPSLQGIVRDITARKRAEEAIKNIAAGVSAEIGEAFFHQLVMNLGRLFNSRYVYIGLLDEQDTTCINTLAVSEDGVVADNFSYRLAGTPCANVVGQTTRTYHGGLQQLFPDDERLKRLDVEIYIGTPLFDAFGKPLGLIALLYDKPLENIEWMGEILQIFASRASAELERVRTEHDLFVKERAMEVATEGILLLDAGRDNMIMYANRAMELMTGYHRDELLGQTLQLLMGTGTDPDSVVELHEALDQRQPCQLELINYRKDGLAYRSEITMTPVEDESGRINHFIVTQIDITERRQTEEALRRSQKMEAIGQLAGGVAHDFNNQLGVIIGYLDFLHKRLAGDDKPRQWVEIATQATQRCIDLTRQLLAFSRLKTGATTTFADLNRELDRMETLITRSITPAITLRTLPGDGLWLVAVDTGEFQDAILNLVLNARDAMPDGGALTIETGNKQIGSHRPGFNLGLAPGDYVQVIVSDTGQGMDKATTERVFEPFFTTKPEGKGTGLGLAMVYGFTRRYGGDIKVYSEPGVGTTFYLYLPRAREEKQKTRLPKGSQPSLPRGTETILVVDDEPELLRLADENLNSLGYRTYTADNPGAAISLLKQHDDIDLLFSDVVMPGDINGYALAEEAVRIRTGLKVLLTSGFTANTSAVDGQERFADNLLHKPYRLDELARRVRDTLDGKDVS